MFFPIRGKVLLKSRLSFISNYKSVMEPPFFSIIIPTYSRPGQLQVCLQSLLRLDYPRDNFEVIVVDDGSPTPLGDVVAEFENPLNLRLIRQQNAGPAAARNTGVKYAKGKFIAFTDDDCTPDSDWLTIFANQFAETPNCILGGKTVNKLSKNPFASTSQLIVDIVYRHYNANFKQARFFASNNMAIPARLYRELGGFNEQLRTSEDRELCDRWLHRGYQMVYLPEAVIYHAHQLTFYKFCKQHFSYGQGAYRFHKIRAVRGSGTMQGEMKFHANLRNWLFYPFTTVKGGQAIVLGFLLLMWQLINTVGFTWEALRQSCKRDFAFLGGKRIAYYLWHYPILSETFIQREITALQQAGLTVEVIADAPDDLEVLDPQARALADTTHYLLPVNKFKLLKIAAFFLLMRPLRTISSFFFVRKQEYHHYKSFKEDIAIFTKAIYLAGVFREKHINHGHCPWSDVNAFILLVASRLTGIPYSAQARAHDVHRKISAYAMPEKFGNAKFVITNCRYNEDHLKSFLDRESWPKIHTIYEGLNLSRFSPNSFRKDLSKELRLFTVARIIEQKGFAYLLQACKILKDRGVSFRCDIIGAAEEPLYIDYYEKIIALHKQLGLQDCVFFLGGQPFPKVIDAYRQTDIFVLPCVLAEDGSRDITPNSLMEAMAMKLPVITTPVTGVPEIVDDGVNGILIPTHNEQALVEAILKLKNDPELRRVLGENARQKIEKRFDISKNILCYAELFQGKKLNHNAPTLIKSQHITG